MFISLARNVRAKDLRQTSAQPDNFSLDTMPINGQLGGVCLDLTCREVPFFDKKEQ